MAPIIDREGKVVLYRLTATGRDLLDGLLHRAEVPA